MEKLSRRKALMSLAVAGAGAAMAGAANAQVADDTNLNAQKERLRNVLGHVEIANDLIKGAAARWVNPPEPGRPAFETLLSNINTECQSVMDTTRELLLRRGA
jgi:hypothetical protein